MLEVKRKIIKSGDIRKAPSYLSLVSCPVKDLLVMGPAVDMFMRILDPGRLSTFSQFNTLRIS